MNSIGKVVVLEGLDGCGKGEQFKKLLQMVGGTDLHRRDIVYKERRVIFTREPGGTPFAEKMRTMIFSEKDLSGKTQLFNFFAARNDHWERVIAPAVHEGALVFCDRSDASTFAFQLYGQNEGEDMQKFFWGTRHFVYGDCEPDAYLFIDVAPTECQRRLKEVAFKAGREVTHFDTRSLDFHEKVRSGYLAFGDFFRDTERCITINGEQSIEKVHDDIRLHIERMLQ